MTRVPKAKDDGVELLTYLLALPRIVAMQPVLRVPDQLRAQAATVLWTLLSHAVRAAKLGPEKGKEAVLAHQLLWAAPALLFRPNLRGMDNKGQSGMSAAEVDADGGESTQAAIRERLAKAVGGKWLELAKDVVDDTKRHAAKKPSSGEPQHDGQALPDAVL